MKLDPEIVKQLMALFTVELEEQLQAITDGLLQLEQGIEDEEERQEILNTIFRAAHNIKGAARGVEKKEISEIAHHLESFFSSMKLQNLTPDKNNINLCLHALDLMKKSGQEETSNKVMLADVKEVCEQLSHIYSDTETKQPVTPSSNKTAEKQAPIKKTPNKTTAKKKSVNQKERVKEKVLEKKSDNNKPKNHMGEIIHLSVEKLDKVATLTDEVQVARVSINDEYENVRKIHNQVNELAINWESRRRLLGNEDISLPDSFQKLFFESMDVLNELRQSTNTTQQNMRSTSSQFSQAVTELQHHTRLLRLVQVATVLQPLSRSVRDIALELNKDIKYVLSGTDIEIDRAVLDGVRDPLMHLLRNAIDHGIEHPAERSAAGKPEQGTISIDVTSEAGQIVMRIHDDGSGIRLDAIREAALRKKVLTESEINALSREDLLDVVFRPGFSIKKIITDVSGRGVGLDVVRANLRALKGSVKVKTVEGEGTTFILSLPLTLSSESGLLLRVAGQTMAIPASVVERVLDIKPEDVINVEASQAIMLDERPVPLRSLASAIDMPVRDFNKDDFLSIVIISKGWERVALVVDEILTERDMIVKPLKAPLISVPNVMGASISGTGEIIMVLNPAELVDSALRFSRQSRLIDQQQHGETYLPPHILVVDDSITTRTLEQNILQSMGYKVTIAVDGKKAWDIIQEQTFDLIVTDVEMPNMDGFGLTNRVKSNDKYREIPVIIVTSLAKDSDRQRGIEVGANAYIVKGEFETKALVDIVQQLL